ncbi:hypothetical protein IWW45_001346, partial [Coemansia sp. RSA 485]
DLLLTRKRKGLLPAAHTCFFYFHISTMSSSTIRSTGTPRTLLKVWKTSFRICLGLGS